MSEAFFQLYSNLECEGPGEAADVHWALGHLSLPPGAMICDLACGSGADLGALAARGPNVRVVGIERQAHFVAQARQRCADEPRIEVRQGDMTTPGGPYDLIWCAGAIYFQGIESALNIWRPALRPGGVVAFSVACWWTDQPSDPARDFWAEYPAMTDAVGIGKQVEAAGYQTRATRRLAASAWSAYYRSLQKKVDQLRGNADPELAAVLDDSQTEIDVWTQFGSEYSYLMSIVKPV